MVLPALAARHEIALFVDDDGVAAAPRRGGRGRGRVPRGRSRPGGRSVRRTTSRRSTTRGRSISSSTSSATPAATTTCGPTSPATPAWSCSTTRSSTSRAPTRSGARPARRSPGRVRLRPPRRPAGRRRLDHRRPRQPRRPDLAPDRRPARRRPRRRRPLPRARRPTCANAWPGLDVHVIRHGSPDISSGRMVGRELGKGSRSADLDPKYAESAISRDVSPDHSPDEITFAAFGLVTPEKRVPQMLRALAAIRGVVPAARLRLVGDVAPHYDVDADAGRTGSRIWSRSPAGSTTTPSIAQILASDVCLCLRWPTNREASGPWLRALAAGKPTVINDLAHLVDLPTLDPRTWEVQVAATAAADAGAGLAPRGGHRRRGRHPGRGSLAGDRDAPPGARRRRCAPSSAPPRAATGPPTTPSAHMAADYERAIAAAAAAPGRTRPASASRT